MAKFGWGKKPGMMRSNDGTPIPVPDRQASKEGFLQPHTEYSNEEFFNSAENASRSSAISDGAINGMNSVKEEMLDKPGFIADGSWIYKKGTPFGEASMFNQLPPGMNINDQAYVDIRNMPMRYYTGKLSFEGDGAFQEERDIPE